MSSRGDFEACGMEISLSCLVLRAHSSYFLRMLFLHSYGFPLVLSLILAFPTVQGNCKTLECFKRFFLICLSLQVSIQQLQERSVAALDLVLLCIR